MLRLKAGRIIPCLLAIIFIFNFMIDNVYADKELLEIVDLAPGEVITFDTDGLESNHDVTVLFDGILTHGLDINDDTNMRFYSTRDGYTHLENTFFAFNPHTHPVEMQFMVEPYYDEDTLIRYKDTIGNNENVNIWHTDQEVELTVDNNTLTSQYISYVVVDDPTKHDSQGVAGDRQFNIPYPGEEKIIIQTAGLEIISGKEHLTEGLPLSLQQAPSESILELRHPEPGSRISYTPLNLEFFVRGTSDHKSMIYLNGNYIGNILTQFDHTLYNTIQIPVDSDYLEYGADNQVVVTENQTDKLLYQTSFRLIDPDSVHEVNDPYDDDAYFELELPDSSIGGNYGRYITNDDLSSAGGLRVRGNTNINDDLYMTLHDSEGVQYSQNNNFNNISTLTISENHLDGSLYAVTVFTDENKETELGQVIIEITDSPEPFDPIYEPPSDDWDHTEPEGFRETIVHYLRLPFEMLNSAIETLVTLVEDVRETAQNLASLWSSFFGFLPGEVTAIFVIGMVAAVILRVFGR